MAQSSWQQSSAGMNTSERQSLCPLAFSIATPPMKCMHECLRHWSMDKQEFLHALLLTISTSSRHVSWQMLNIVCCSSATLSAKGKKHCAYFPSSVFYIYDFAQKLNLNILCMGFSIWTDVLLTAKPYWEKWTNWILPAFHQHQRKQSTISILHCSPAPTWLFVYADP